MYYKHNFCVSVKFGRPPSSPPQPARPPKVRAKSKILKPSMNDRRAEKVS